MRSQLVASLLLLAIACDRPKGGAAADTRKPITPSSADIGAWTVRPEAYGPLSLGAPATQANALLNGALGVDTSRADVCQMVRSPATPENVRFLVERDSAGAPQRLERIDVVGAGVRTAEGAGIGDTEARIRELYGARVIVQPHKYVSGGHYLIVNATDDTLHRIVFETDGQRVTRFRAGHRPAVDYVEACS